MQCDVIQGDVSAPLIIISTAWDTWEERREERKKIGNRENKLQTGCGKYEKKHQPK